MRVEKHGALVWILCGLAASGCWRAPDTPEARYLATVRARAYLEQGDTGRAHDLTRHLARDSRDAEAWTNLGLVDSQRGAHADAERAWSTAVALDPHCARALYLLGASRRERAQSLLERARQGGRHAEEHRQEGLALLQNAAETLAEAARSDPTDPITHRLLGETWNDLGQKEAAARALADAHRVDPDGLRVSREQVGQQRVQLPQLPARSGAAQISMLYEPQPLAVRASGIWRANPNGDARPDLVLRGSRGALVQGEPVPPQRASWTFQEVLPEAPVVLAACAPLDGDESPDLVLFTLDPQAAPPPAPARTGAAKRAPEPPPRGMRLWLLRGAGGQNAELLLRLPCEVRSVRAADVDRDGDLDLVVAAAAVPGVRVLWNDGRAGFDAATPASGFENLPRMRSLACTDLNGDGAPDVACADDGGRMRVLVQRQDGGFAEIGAIAGLAHARARVLESFDVDVDGTEDLILGNDAGLWVYVNRGGARFVAHAVYRAPQSGWSNQRRRGVPVAAMLVLDADNDGLQDVVTLNLDAAASTFAPVLPAVASAASKPAGAARGEDTAPEAPAPALQPETRTSSLGMWRNDGRGLLLDDTERLDLGADSLLTTAPVAADLDGDGDLDLAVVRADSTVLLLWNEGGSANRRVELELAGTRGLVSAWGARVELYAGTWAQSFAVREQPLWVGLGTLTRLDALRIVWPDGQIQNELDLDVPASGRLRLERGASHR